MDNPAEVRMGDGHGRAPLKLVVVGAGAAGILTAVHVAEEAARTRAPVELTLVDPGPQDAAGVAFSTRDPRHLLNVSAGGMSCLPDRPDHLVRWLVRERMPAATERTFAPRGHYGDYLLATLAARVERARGPLVFRRRSARAVACSVHGDKARVRLSDGARLTADAVVIATGPLAGRAPWAPAELRESGRFVPDPWAPGALDGPLADGRDVLLVGTGLTAVDVALALDRPGRTVHALSRHGRLPRRHALVPLPPVPPAEPLAGLPLCQLRPAVLRHIRRVTDELGDWRPAFDGLRPLVSRLWAGLDDEERTEFLRSHRHLWEIHRHRMAPETAETVTRLRTAGRLRLHTGEVTAARPDGDTLTVTVTGSRRLGVGWVVDCTGQGLRVAESPDPLLSCLVSAGPALPGPLGIGLATTAEGRLRARDGAVEPLWTLGAHRRGDLWESTAVPEIREQAAALARTLLKSRSTTGRSIPSAERVRPVPVPARPGATVWLTGLPGAGTSGIAAELAARIRSEGHRVEVLDGDEIGAGLPAGPGSARADREERVRRVGMVAEVLARNGVVVLVPDRAPGRGARDGVRLRHDLARVPYLEVHVAAPVAARAAREAGGPRTRRAAGAPVGAAGVTGVADDPYEPPDCPELRLETHRRTPAESADAVHALLTERGLL
ncbi:FAD/NAD(P)-binding protein [Streptomyces misionensis]|uniref:FAD/NAD(P)-binding protein n=1 Tax=Streptomyces misionensis TaxID=67331 RepID=UPI003BAE3FB1